MTLAMISRTCLGGGASGLSSASGMAILAFWISLRRKPVNKKMLIVYFIVINNEVSEQAVESESLRDLFTNHNQPLVCYYVND